jgi:glycosyltransferase involved in cell wall biosynthesis
LEKNNNQKMKQPKDSSKIKVLWFSPSFNHYKARFLNHLAHDPEIDLTILAGKGRNNMGDSELNEHWDFHLTKVSTLKKDFGNSRGVRQEIKKVFSDFDWVMIPMEKKNMLLFLYTRFLRWKHPQVRLFSYNHPVLRSGASQSMPVDKWLTKWFFNHLDRVIFYTQKSWEWVLEQQMIKPQKAFWANNTIDTEEIDKHYNFQYPPKKPKILFIGRLISSKRIPDLVSYFKRLKALLPELTLDIIGDGPERQPIKELLSADLDVTWHGTIVDEALISPIMKESSLVFVPGHSGLSVNHAFAYGRPYVTLQGPSHAPEIIYIAQGKNGYVLDGNFEENIELMQKLLEDYDLLASFCRYAKATGDNLTVDKWVAQIKSSLIDAE